MKIFKILISASILVALTSCNSQTVTKKELKSEVDTISYALGLNMANQLKVNFDDIDKTLFIQGFRNGTDSTDILLKDADLNGLLSTFFKKRQLAQQQKAQEEAAKKVEVDFAEVKKAGEEFLAENKSKDGVQTTASGLQYIVLKQGNGEKPVATSRLKVHYHGTSIDGTVFDSSVDRGEPSQFKANEVITGWTEGLQLMNVGSKYKFFIPQELAYGAFPRPNGPVKPLQALVFEVELLEIIK
jgi:FKBP-type peptidyl-prolyl cis-trans isomerase FklB